MVGPRVISWKSREAGYLLVLRNEKSAGSCGRPFAFACGKCQWLGSPQRLKPRKTRKSPVAERPICQQRRFRRTGSSVIKAPKPYPNAITPTQGTIEYKTISVGPCEPN